MNSKSKIYNRSRPACMVSCQKQNNSTAIAIQSSRQPAVLQRCNKSGCGFANRQMSLLAVNASPAYTNSNFSNPFYYASPSSSRHLCSLFHHVYLTVLHDHAEFITAQHYAPCSSRHQNIFLPETLPHPFHLALFPPFLTIVATCLSTIVIK